jgi:hypothetical protein
MDLPAGIKIREKSPVAWFAAKKLKSSNAAIVLGKTIHLSGVSSKEFLACDEWVKHELKHVEQFTKYGFLKFIVMYLQESLRLGYHNNRFEVEARQAEKE